MAKPKKKIVPVADPIKLDLGCGPNKREGFIGIDQFAFDGEVDHVLNIGSERLPYDDGSVEEIHTSHFIEHLTPVERCHVINECYRVLKIGGKVTIIVPHWGSCRAYGDPSHQWPPVSEFWFYYLDKNWRQSQAPHTDKKTWPLGYDCDFMATWGYSLHESLNLRNSEYQQNAVQWFKEAIQDIQATLVKR
jgi:SAM-dependent methyltransferase